MDIIIKELKSKKKVGFVPMTSKMELLAAQKAGNTSKFDGSLRFINEEIRLTLREIDGQPVMYDTLIDLDAHFSYSEIVELRKCFSDINLGGLEDDPLAETA